MNTDSHGLTLIELLVVIAIIGVLAVLLVPNLLGARARAFDTAAAGCAKQIASAQATFQIDSQGYADDLASLNSGTADMAGNCERDWVSDSGDFTAGWEVQHPLGTGRAFTVGPGGIVSPP